MNKEDMKDFKTIEEKIKILRNVSINLPNLFVRLFFCSIMTIYIHIVLVQIYNDNIVNAVTMLILPDFIIELIDELKEYTKKLNSNKPIKKIKTKSYSNNLGLNYFQMIFVNKVLKKVKKELTKIQHNTKLAHKT